MNSLEKVYKTLKTNLVSTICDAINSEELKNKTIENLILYCEVGEHAGCAGLYFNSSLIQACTQAQLEEKCKVASTDAYADTIQILKTVFDLSLVDEINALLGEEFNVDLESDPYDTELIIYVLAKICAELENNPNKNGLDEIPLGENWKILIDEQEDFDFNLMKQAHKHINLPLPEFIEVMAQ